ncbi:hypothetical protein HanOQP8_Chr15g0557981 [Helianthus annuus]|nr:hypothetical protein HanLR1_Chr15g0560021 [Helianthus annuus]KAJ0651156.1 hypothetical protein HanOQP8_Chr15g0557981 [Helianthus annuus]
MLHLYIHFKHFYQIYVFRYDIRLGTHDTFQDCVSVMRLYKRMRSQEHQDYKTATSWTKQNLVFDNGTSKDLENMSPDELFQISTPNYQCWCLDSRPRDPP